MKANRFLSTPVPTLLWEQARLLLAPVVAVVALCAGVDVAIYILSNDSLQLMNFHNAADLADWCQQLLLMASMLLFFIAHAVRLDIQAGFSPRLFRLPLHAAVIALPVLLVRVLFAGVLLVVVLQAHLFFFGDYSTLSFRWTFVDILALYLAVQALILSVNWQTLRAITISLLLLFELGWFIDRYFSEYYTRLYYVHRVLLILVLLAIAAAAVIRAFRLQRRGDYVFRARLNFWIGRTDADFREVQQPDLLPVAHRASRDAKPKSRKRHASPLAAQNWLEWRLHRSIMPAFLLGIVALLLLQQVLNNQRIFGKYSYLSLPSLLGNAQLAAAFFAGAFITFREYLYQRSAVGRFMLTRPLSTRAFARSKMKMALRAIAATIVTVLILYLIGVSLVPQWAGVLRASALFRPDYFALDLARRVSLWTLVMWILFWSVTRLNVVLGAIYLLYYYSTFFWDTWNYIDPESRVPPAHAAFTYVLPAAIICFGVAVEFYRAWRRGALIKRELVLLFVAWLLAVVEFEALANGEPLISQMHLPAAAAALAIVPFAQLPQLIARRRTR